MPRIGLTPYQAHAEQWSDCDRCHLSAVRTRVVLARGKVPADVVFVGEAPWKGEDDLGQPFVGRAGREIDDWVDRAVQMAGVPEVRVAFTNLIGCIPLAGPDGSDDPVDSRGTKPPPREAIEACIPRVEEFLLDVAKPKVVVTVGKHARDWMEPGVKGSVRVPPGVVLAHVVHPGWVIRQVVAHQSFARQRAVVAIRDALVEMSDPDRTPGVDQDLPF